MLRMRLNHEGRVDYVLEAVERKPMTRSEKERCMLFPKLPKPDMDIDVWKCEYAEELGDITNTLMELLNTFQPPMRVHVDTHKFRRLVSRWVYDTSDNRKKSFYKTAMY